MTVSPTSSTLESGQTLQLNKTINPSTATEGVQWASSNTSVATVSNSGLVTAKNSGTATITLKNSSGTKTATCIIKVQNEIIIGRAGINSAYGYLDKYNANGQKIWSVELGVGGINVIQPTSDGNYIIGRAGINSAYGYLDKYNANGQKIWSVELGVGGVNVIQSTSDGNYIIGRAGINSAYGYLDKYNANGQKIWSVELGVGGVNTIIFP